MALLHSRQIWPALILVLALLIFRQMGESGGNPAVTAAHMGGEAVEQLFESQSSGMMVQVEGVVERLLADDLEGSPHQRFVLRLGSDHTLLVAHNIDLAPRVPLKTGDRVSLSGQYEWNEKGGVIHWTHHDPRQQRPGGWIRHEDQLYH